MQFKKCLPLIFCLFSYLLAPAASCPAKVLTPFVFGDTTLAMPMLVEKNFTVSEKKPSFFARLKNKVLVFALKKSMRKQEGSNTKIVLGYIGLGLLALAFPLLLLTHSAPLLLGMSIAGFLGGLVSVLLPGSNKKNVAGKVTVIIGGILLVLLIILAIALSNSKWSWG